MLMQPPSRSMLKEWQQVWNDYREQLKPNRKSGRELLVYLYKVYPLEEIHETEAAQVVAGNVMENWFYAEKLHGAPPNPAAFYVRDEGKGVELYRQQDNLFRGQRIFVGIDLTSGFYCVEGSSLLWDELCAFQGLDGAGLKNAACVACCKSLAVWPVGGGAAPICQWLSLFCALETPCCLVSGSFKQAAQLYFEG